MHHALFCLRIRKARLRALGQDAALDIEDRIAEDELSRQLKGTDEISLRFADFADVCSGR